LQLTTKTVNILITEDEFEVRNYLELSLRCRGYGVQHAENGDEVLARLRERGGAEISLILLDIRMPCRDGFETLREIRSFNKNLPIIMLSCDSSLTTVVEAMKYGATDFLAKPIGNDELMEAVQRTLEPRTAVRVLPKKDVTVPASAPKLVMGASGWMEKSAAMLRQVGASDIPVLLNGETGVGKEVLARSLHAASPRASRRFLKVNCAALPSELIESELFGYERGAFTGANKPKPGKFDMADGGTILLDEIGDMDFRLQAKLLQVLQDQEFERLGGTETIRVDVRVMAATHNDLEKAVKEGRFREDLYYRLNVVNLVVPPLRDRPEEVLPLARFFLEKFASPAQTPPEITGELESALLNHAWPGNVRELENFVRKYLVLQDPAAAAEELRLKYRARTPARVTTMQALVETPSVPASSLERVTEVQKKAEKEAILAALNRTRWNRKQAARVLGVDYKALLYKMKKHDISRDFEDGGGLYIASDSPRFPAVAAASN
jgi:two-component system, NtrC family, response regulator AtoC